MAITNKELYESMEALRKELEADMKDLDIKIDKTYTKLEAFLPVKNVVYGMIGLILTTVILALIGMVVVR